MNKKKKEKMTGAHKCNKNDIIKLQELFNAGLKDGQIAKDFVTENGNTLSREHISRIRKGERWNPNIRSFIVKDELGSLQVLETRTPYGVFYSEVGKLITKTGEKWVYLHFKDTLPAPYDVVWFDNENDVKEHFLTSHLNFVKNYLS